MAPSSRATRHMISQPTFREMPPEIVKVRENLMEQVVEIRERMDRADACSLGTFNLAMELQHLQNQINHLNAIYG